MSRLSSHMVSPKFSTKGVTSTETVGNLYVFTGTSVVRQYLFLATYFFFFLI